MGVVRILSPEQHTVTSAAQATQINMFWENMFKPCAVKDKGDHDHGDMMTVYDSYITPEQPSPMYTVTPPPSQLMKQSVSSDSEPLTSTVCRDCASCIREVFISSELFLHETI